jgi:hypothetical protein
MKLTLTAWLKRVHEFFRADTGLFQYPFEGAATYLPMHWHDTAAIAATQDRVAAALPFENKSQPLQCAPGLLS